MRSISFVTGVDHAQFDQLHLLMGSLRRSCPDLRLHVCDLGLSDPQRDFLIRKNMLLPMPDGLAGAAHPWYRKAALSRYTAGLDSEAVVWLDVDMIVLSDIRPGLEAILDDMRPRGQVIAVAGSTTIGAQLAASRPSHYARLVSGFPQDRPYLNSGFFLCRSRGFLDRWDRLCATMPMEMLFEQNAFNLIALEFGDNVRLIDPMEWNLCANEMGNMRVEISDQTIAVTGSRGNVRILHATSNDKARDLVLMLINLTFRDARFKPRVRMIRAPQSLFAAQQQLVVDALAADFDLLKAAGLAAPRTD